MKAKICIINYHLLCSKNYRRVFNFCTKQVRCHVNNKRFFCIVAKANLPRRYLTHVNKATLLAELKAIFHKLSSLMSLCLRIVILKRRRWPRSSFIRNRYIMKSNSNIARWAVRGLTFTSATNRCIRDNSDWLSLNVVACAYCRRRSDWGISTQK